MPRANFGLELELCFHDLKTEIEDIPSLIAYLNTQGPEEWQTLDLKTYKDLSGAYLTWGITTDSSIHCDEYQGKECARGGRKVDCVVADKEFFSLEIVSPIMQRLTTVTDVCAILSQPRFLWLINSSQGFHVTLSYDRLDPVNFIRFWLTFENVLESFIPEYRRSTEYTENINNRIVVIREEVEEEYENREEELPDEDVLNEIAIQRFLQQGEKRYSVHVKGDHLIEIRIHEGTINCDVIRNWVHMCLLMVYASVSFKPTDVPYGYGETGSDTGKTELFFDYVKVSKGLRKYLQKK